MARPIHAFLTTLCLAFALAACGGGGGGGGTVGATPGGQGPGPGSGGGSSSNLDLFVGDPNLLHVYRDAANLTAQGELPDVALGTLNMRDFDVEGGRLFVARDATPTTVVVDIYNDQTALTANSIPDVTLTIPTPVNFNGIVARSIDVEGDVLCLLTESYVPNILPLASADVYVFTGLGSLTNQSTANAVVPLIAAEPISTFIGELVLSNEVMCVQGPFSASIFVYKDPSALTGASLPDATLPLTVPQGLRLDNSTLYAWDTAGGGRLVAFRNISAVTSQTPPSINLFGQSLVGGGLFVACCEAGNRLFVSSDIATNGVAMVGFDDPATLIGGDVPDMAMSLVPAQPYVMDSAANHLFVIDVAAGSVLGYPNADTMQTDTAPSTTLTSVAMPAPALLRVVARP